MALSDKNINKEFERSIKQFVKKDVDEKSKKNLRKIALQALKMLLKRSPVDEGTFRGNWYVGINYEKRDMNMFRLGKDARSQGYSVIGSIKDKKVKEINFTNSLPYANRIEHGWSDQAPIGVVRVTKIELTRAINKILKGE